MSLKLGLWVKILTVCFALATISSLAWRLDARALLLFLLSFRVHGVWLNSVLDTVDNSMIMVFLLLRQSCRPVRQPPWCTETYNAIDQLSEQKRQGLVDYLRPPVLRVDVACRPPRWVAPPPIPPPRLIKTRHYDQRSERYLPGRAGLQRSLWSHSHFVWKSAWNFFKWLI